MSIDLWYKGEQIARADCAFYPNSGIFCGNLYNRSGRIIGDFTSKSSVEVEKRFPGIFGK